MGELCLCESIWFDNFHEKRAFCASLDSDSECGEDSEGDDQAKGGTGGGIGGGRDKGGRILGRESRRAQKRRANLSQGQLKEKEKEREKEEKEREREKEKGNAGGGVGNEVNNTPRRDGDAPETLRNNGKEDVFDMKVRQEQLHPLYCIQKLSREQ